MAAFRAVENRRYLVRAANTGITAVVDPWGRVLEPTRLFEPTVLVREVPLVAETTFYTRHGDVFARPAPPPPSRSRAPLRAPRRADRALAATR